MKNPNQQWNDYLGSKSVRPKTFAVTLERDRNGTYKIVGNGALMFDIVNQYESKWTKVDARDLAVGPAPGELPLARSARGRELRGR